MSIESDWEDEVAEDSLSNIQRVKRTLEGRAALCWLYRHNNQTLHECIREDFLIHVLGKDLSNRFYADLR